MQRLLLPVCLLSVSLSDQIFAGSPQTKPQGVKTAVIVYSPAIPLVGSSQEVDPARLEGDYVVGDGLGCNLRVVLKANGKFDSMRIGCLGVCGVEAGDWRIDDKGIRLTAKTSDGALKNRPLTRLYLASFRHHYLLLQDETVGCFKAVGPSTSNSLHKVGSSEGS